MFRWEWRVVAATEWGGGENLGEEEFKKEKKVELKSVGKEKVASGVKGGRNRGGC
ncbi:hypothetical protein LguiB_024448 [Lonicera macranthoides]